MTDVPQPQTESRSNQIESRPNLVRESESNLPQRESEINHTDHSTYQNISSREFSSKTLTNGLFITVPSMSPNKQDAITKTKQYLEWWDLQGDTFKEKTQFKEMSGCVEMHTAAEADRSLERPWHCHIVIYFSNRVTQSANLYHRLCTPFITFVRQQTDNEQPVHVDWLRNRNQAYKYITKQGAEQVILEPQHPLYFNPKKLRSNQESHGNKDQDYNATNIMRTEFLMKNGVKQAVKEGYYPASQLKQLIAAEQFLREKPLAAKPVVFLITGPTGQGKTYHFETKEMFGECYGKDPRTKWFENYQEQPCVLIDEIPGYQNHMCYYYKKWLDEYAFQAEVKGASVWVRPEIVVMTSNFGPHDIWAEKGFDGKITSAATNDLYAIFRRIDFFWEVCNPNFLNKQSPDYHVFMVKEKRWNCIINQFTETVIRRPYEEMTAEQLIAQAKERRNEGEPRVIIDEQAIHDAAQDAFEMDALIGGGLYFEEERLE